MRKFFAKLAAFMGFSTSMASNTIKHEIEEFYTLHRQVYDLQTRIDSGSPIFYPKKHTKQTYRSQQRAARKRRRARA